MYASVVRLLPKLLPSCIVRCFLSSYEYQPLIRASLEAYADAVLGNVGKDDCDVQQLGAEINDFHEISIVLGNQVSS